jgi:hypothetical protein
VTGEQIAEGLVVVRCFLGAILLWSATAKLLDITGNSEAIAAHVHLARAAIAFWIAVSAELVIGTLLLATALADEAIIRWLPAAAAAALFGVFAVTLLRSYRRGVRTPCACFGDTGALLSRITVVRSILFFLTMSAVAVAELLLPGRDYAGVGSAAVGLGVAAAGAIAVWLIARAVLQILPVTQPVRLDAQARAVASLVRDLANSSRKSSIQA